MSGPCTVHGQQRNMGARGDTAGRHDDILDEWSHSQTGAVPTLGRPGAAHEVNARRAAPLSCPAVGEEEAAPTSATDHQS